jgi:integrase
LWKWAHSRDIVLNALMDNLGITFPKLKRTRVYADAEIAAIWRAADQLKPDQAAFFKLLILLAPRKTALAGLEWSHVRDGVWTTPNALTKSTKGNEERVYQTPLTPLALRILAGLPHTHDRVFPTVDWRPTQRLSNMLVRNGAPADFMFHACRHTVATWLDKHGGASVYEIGLVLNHANAGVTANYIHGHALPLKLKWLTTWADHVTSIVQPEGVTVLR